MGWNVRRDVFFFFFLAGVYQSFPCQIKKTPHSVSSSNQVFCALNCLMILFGFTSEVVKYIGISMTVTYILSQTHTATSHTTPRLQRNTKQDTRPNFVPLVPVEC